MSSIYLGHALCPALQHIYEQTFNELSKYGREQDRYYCRRLGRYVSEEEIALVTTLENVLWQLEEGDSAEKVLELVENSPLVVHGIVDQHFHGLYVEMLRQEAQGVEFAENGHYPYVKMLVDGKEEKQ